MRFGAHPFADGGEIIARQWRRGFVGGFKQPRFQFRRNGEMFLWRARRERTCGELALRFVGFNFHFFNR